MAGFKSVPVAGFKSVPVAGFKSEDLAGFVGIRTLANREALKDATRRCRGGLRPSLTAPARARPPGRRSG